MKTNLKWTKLRRFNRSEEAKEETFQKIQNRLREPNTSSRKKSFWQPVVTIVALCILVILVTSEFLNSDGSQKRAFLEEGTPIDHLALERGTDEQEWLLERYTDETLEIRHQEQIDEFTELAAGEHSIVDHDIDSDFQVLITKTNEEKNLLNFEFQREVTYVSVSGESEVYQLSHEVGDRLLSWYSFWPSMTITEVEFSPFEGDDQSTWVEGEEEESIIIEDEEWLERFQDLVEKDLPERVDERLSRERFFMSLGYQERDGGNLSFNLDIREDDVLISTDVNQQRGETFRYDSEMKELFDEILEASTP
ncbi:hypothetical protein [Salipaludibacillus daqingensis]|uniref:hypothetical protein n=1 Tax=Salipaludibacillus daqingensis TaxID=3041001 RepID=UPI0024767048|nr:hypothetical protein [Salipaludibacillus daqingensis]